MQEQLINTTVIEKLQNALAKVKDAYIQQKQLNSELSTKLKEVTFGRDKLLQENRELQKKIDLISTQNNKKDDEINNMINEIDSLLNDDSLLVDKELNSLDSATFEKNDHIINNNDVSLELTDLKEEKKSQSNNSNHYKAIDDTIDFDNVEDLLSSLNDD